ncbi:MAG TPA: hypothetical protein VKI41_16955 [Vicinamibacteria bacterium]|nr:hypothetical protein [Vicinamibacteria bacterium]
MTELLLHLGGAHPVGQKEACIGVAERMAGVVTRQTRGLDPAETLWGVI